jgi:single-stranded-DNA-specific exonuclease
MGTTMTSRWQLRPHDPAQIGSLSQRAGVTPLVAQLLLNRGIDDPTLARSFLDARLGGLHDPECLPGAPEAAERIVNAIRAGRKIVIYGDYDVDGVCGTSILWSCLRLAGVAEDRVSYYIPHRVEEGYGVSGDALRRIKDEQGAELVVTVDCGISAVAEARLARELGLELIVTDHHTIGTTLPEADVVVHPRLEGSRYPCPDLCGAGVAFKVAWQVCKSFGDGKKASPHLRDFLVQSISLVALATVADIVPLGDENRILVRHGLKGMFDRPTEGQKALLKVCGCLDKKRLTAGMVGFGLAPRINAAGRLERAMMAVEMLTTDDPALASKIADELNRCNTKRQEVEKTMVAEAQAMIRGQGGLGDRCAIVLGRAGWHPGVVGIVASRLVDIYHRPTIIVALGEGVSQGSARSIAGFDVHHAIGECSAGLIAFGGHKAAAGLKLEAAAFESFAAEFDRYCRSVLTAEQLHKVLSIDAEVPLGMLTLRVVEEIEALEPHGIGNPRPLLVASRVRVVGEPRGVGEHKNHLQFRVAQGGAAVKAIGWGLAERGKALAAGVVCSLAFTPTINEWQNRREVQLEVKDFKLDEASEDAQSPTPS